MYIQRIYDDPQVGKVVLRKKVGVRRVSIRVSSRGVSVTLPFVATYDEALRFFLSKKEWVLKTMEKQRETVPGKVLSAQEVEQLRRQAADYLPERLATLRHHDHSRAFHLLLEHLLTDHLLKLMDSAPASDSASPTPSSEVKMASTIVHAAAKSKAQFPIDHVCSTLIRRYKLI